jgi:hypothetical protein
MLFVRTKASSIGVNENVFSDRTMFAKWNSAVYCCQLVSVSKTANSVNFEGYEVRKAMTLE